VKPCQYLYLATQMTKGIVKITNILLQCAVHLHGVDKSLLLLIEKSLESLVVTQWADMAASDGMVDTLTAEVVATAAGEGGLLQELKTQRTLELIWQWLYKFHHIPNIQCFLVF